MCGISGIITKEKIEDQKIKKLLSLMRNRGPDGQQFFHITNIDKKNNIYKFIYIYLKRMI